MFNVKSNTTKTMKEVLKEWKITVPWGKLALVSWGDPSKEPMLIVHGRQDSVDTFRPLIEYLPDRYHIVGLDLPGHGESDPLPYGVQLTRLHFVKAVELVVDHLKWKTFVYLAHSMGGELGMFYASFHPNRISRMILLDSIVALRSIQIEPWSQHYARYYHDYYSNYAKYNSDPRTYTRQRAVEVVMKARGLTRDQAELVLRRNLQLVGDDVYKLKWDMRLKFLAPINLSNEAYVQILTQNAPPTLFLVAKVSMQRYATKEVLDLIAQIKKNSKVFDVVVYEGGHDLHLTCTEKVSECVIQFLDRDFGAKSKL